METLKLLESIRSDIKRDLREELLAELQAEIERRLYANIFDFSEACLYLKVSDSTLRKMIKDEGTPYFRQRGRIYFSQTSLNKWIAEKEKEGA
ncbi:helix-turn-helix domain-containing protein [Paenibacillus sp. F4]|uniref:helix-turn-helix domain-containing protein n=1 Tax=Paenibacillus sp. F4 TaxID=357385 RepID=UPI000C9F0C52|nr:helix-turn-helix domain-containing protein [Paenibacillus sp. F4]PNQ81929.1 DNA-binding protein [Paenibacillus sp. F4]